MKYWGLAAAISSIMLTACTTSDTAPASAAAEPAPTNYRAMVAASVRQNFFDPYSIRDASISQPLYASAVFDGITPIPRRGWIVCVRANAKNRMGAYTGQQYSVMLFRGNEVELTLSGPSFRGQVDNHCRSGSFSPFPEIEQG